MWRKLLDRKISSLRYAKQIRTIGSIVLGLVSIFLVYWISGAALLSTHQSPNTELPVFDYIIILYPVVFLIFIFPPFSNLCKKYRTVSTIFISVSMGAMFSSINMHNHAQDNLEIPLISPLQYSSLYIERIEMIIQSKPDTKRRPIS